jgi:hypothetical protein
MCQASIRSGKWSLFSTTHLVAPSRRDPRQRGLESAVWASSLDRWTNPPNSASATASSIRKGELPAPVRNIAVQKSDRVPGIANLPLQIGCLGDQFTTEQHNDFLPQGGRKSMDLLACNHFRGLGPPEGLRVVVLQYGTEKLAEAGVLPLQKPQRQAALAGDGHQKAAGAPIAQDQRPAPPAEAGPHSIRNLLLRRRGYMKRVKNGLPGPGAFRVLPAKSFRSIEAEHRRKPERLPV